MVEAVEQALAAGDALGALRELLAWWRRTPAPEIADAIDRVGATVAAPEIGSWEDAAAADRPEDVGVLLATLVDVKPQIAARRVSLLAKRPADPRIAIALARHVRAPPYKTSTSQRFYQLALDLIDQIGDVRALDVLPVEPIPVTARQRTKADSTLGVYLPIVRDRLARIELPHLDDDAHVRLAALATISPPAPTPITARTRRSAQDISTLLDAVYADPASDEPRLVLADALQELGDPRGEFIALQLGRERTGAARAGRRESALVKEHGRTWMGELADFVHAKGWYFRRGFLAGCRVGGQQPPPPTRLWRTVEELHLREAAGVYARPLVLGMSSLRVLSGIGSEVARVIARADAPPPLESLSFGIARSYEPSRNFDEVVRSLASSPLRLRRLALMWWDGDREAVRLLLEARIAERLEQLVVCGRPRHLGDWLTAIGNAGPALRTVELRNIAHLDDDLTGYRLVVHRDGGRFTAVDAFGPYADAGPPNSAMAANASVDMIAPAVQAVGLELRVLDKRAGASLP